jgi:hypothetical protein
MTDPVKDTCESLNLYESLSFCPGQSALPGLRNRGYAVQKAQISKFAQLPEITAALKMSEAAVLVGDFEFFADVKAFRIDVNDTASSLGSQAQGEYPNQTYVDTLTFKYSGNNEAAAGFARLVLNDELVFFVQMRDGKWRVVGNEAFSSRIKPAQESGSNVTDASGTTLEVTATSVAPAPFYRGKLCTVDGWLDCKTNVFTEEKPAA